MRIAGRRGGGAAAHPDQSREHQAQPADVWPWLTQMGWHLGGFYTHEWVLTGCSSRRIGRVWNSSGRWPLPPGMRPAHNPPTASCTW